MSQDYVITSKDNNHIESDVVLIDSATQYNIDLSPWVEDNAAIVGTPTWVLKAGNATISGEAINSNITSALINFSSAGKSLIQIKASTASSGIFVVYLELSAKDPNLSRSDDYGLCI